MSAKVTCERTKRGDIKKKQGYVIYFLINKSQWKQYDIFYNLYIKVSSHCIGNEWKQIRYRPHFDTKIVINLIIVVL